MNKAILVVAGAALLGAGVLVGRGIQGDHAGSGGAADAPAQMWTCSMHPQVRQNSPGLCPICRMQLTPVKAGEAAAPHVHEAAKVAFYTDPMMVPPFVSEAAGKSPLGNELVPVYLEGPGAPVVIDATVVQNMGIRVAPVEDGPLMRTVRVTGLLAEAQPAIHDINLRVSGWVKSLAVTQEGQMVEAGTPLFTLYSPELVFAVEEAIAARKANAGAEVLDSAKRKLELLGLDRAMIESLVKLDAAPDVITFASPIAGSVIEKPIVEGASVKSGDRVLRIVDHTKLWVDAQVFEKDLPFVKVGQKADIAVASRPRNVYHSQVSFIHPHVDPMTRAAMVRMELQNTGLALKPGMYATVKIECEVSERAVLVPREAVIDSGDSQRVFVAKSIGKFEPTPVKLGMHADGGMIQVLSGVSAGDQVVTSGQLLLDSESRLQEAIAKYENRAPAAPKSAAPSPAMGDDVAALDEVYREYLGIAKVLGSERKEDTPVDSKGLIERAGALAGKTKNEGLGRAVKRVADASGALAGQPTEKQRLAFKKLSEAMITLTEVSPPSVAIGAKVYIMECPMAPGRWVQDHDEIENPYYFDDMKSCGSLMKEVPTRQPGPAAAGEGGGK